MESINEESTVEHTKDEEMKGKGIHKTYNINILLGKNYKENSVLSILDISKVKLRFR